ncbi:MAG: ABC transporter substrate-binding protein [Deltaproteobacteria bacterium]|nr:ABC transporter substrate-binding protein [Deltaproteobacteria bacterium]MBT4267207.1 ABC transporter substrate-binding protein [Deltaproteobacteria bacterium]
MKKRNQFSMLLFGIFFLIVLGNGSCFAETGVSKDLIKIGATMDLSGPIAFMGKSVRDGAKLYFKRTNDHGGVFGRKIEFIVEDDGYKSPRAVQAVKKLINRDEVFSMFAVLGSAQTNAIYPILKSKGVPLVTPATQNRSVAVPAKELVFLADTHYTQQGKLAVEYVVEDLGNKTPKIAIIFQNDTPGHDWRNGVRIGAKHYGLELMELPYKRGNIDFSSQVAKCKGSGITHVLFWGIVREPAMLMKEAQRANFKPAYVLASPSISKVVLKLAGEAIGYNSNIYGLSLWIDQYRDTSPGLDMFKEDIVKYESCSLEDQYNIYGYQAAMTLVEGLNRAGKDLTRKKLISALETFKDYDNGILSPITWGPDSRAGGRAVKVFKVVNGAWQTTMDGWRFSQIAEE